MTDPETNQAHTAHTINRVPAILVNAPSWAAALDDGRLADVAPSLLALLDLPKPAEMTGRSLIVATGEARKAAPAARAVAE
jgi:2,3-bisphosphoglycerate-independent phosphoglycerate mutase